MKTLADLKRALTVGTPICLVYHFRERQPGFDERLFRAGTVKKAGAKEITIAREGAPESILTFPPASEIIITDREFKIIGGKFGPEELRGKVLMQYFFGIEFEAQ